jgi:hypothetical protein
MRRPVQVEGLDLPLPALREMRTLASFYNTFAGRLFTGEGSPEGVIAADRGALYLRTDGSTSTTLYVKTANAGLKTGWTAK